MELGPIRPLSTALLSVRIVPAAFDEHIQDAARRLGAANRTHAVAIALRERLIRKQPPSVADMPLR